MLTDLTDKDKKFLNSIDQDAVDILTKLSNLQNRLSSYITGNVLLKEAISKLNDKCGEANISILPLVVFAKDVSGCSDEFQLESFLDMELK